MKMIVNIEKENVFIFHGVILRKKLLNAKMEELFAKDFFMFLYSHIKFAIRNERNVKLNTVA